MDDFIIPRLQGGLGNQLFQIAACFAIQKQQTINSPKILIPSCTINPHKSSKIEYETLFLTLPNTYSIKLPEEILQSWNTFANAAINMGINFQNQQGNSFAPWDPSAIQTPCVLEGYFQFWPPLKSLWREFTKCVLSAFPIDPLLPYKGDTNHVFIHVRRGDYVALSDYHYLQDESYYKNALQHFSKDTKFLIFSDDINFCKSCGFFDTIANKIFINEPDEIQALAIMAGVCHGGAICANSTFSYWGAILGPYYHAEERSKVIVPSKWCKDPQEFLFPENWIVL